MRTTNKVLALLLAAVMSVGGLPAAVCAADNVSRSTEDVAAYDLCDADADEVMYNLRFGEVTVSSDAEKVAAGEAVPFDEDGNYTIELEADAYFPYEIEFVYGGRIHTKWFMNEDDSVDFGGHTFYVSSETTDADAITQIGIWVGEEYFPAYPEAKEFLYGQDAEDYAEMLEDGITPFSMMPLEEVEQYIYLCGYFPSELKEISLDVVYSGMDNAAAWADLSSGTPDDYYLLDENNTIDLSYQYSDYDRWYSYHKDIEVIVGIPDQFETSNTRYILEIYVESASNLLNASVVAEDRSDMEQLGSFMSYSYRYYDDERYPYGRLYAEVYEESPSDDVKFYTGITLDEDFVEAGTTAKFYKGFYRTEDEIPADAEEITDIILNQADLTQEGGYLTDQRSSYDDPITAVFMKNGQTVDVLPFYLSLTYSSTSLSVDYYAYADNGSGSRTTATNSRSYSYDSMETITMKLRDGYSADAEYYIGLSLYDPRESADNGSHGINNVKKAVVGDYRNVSLIPSDAEDIREQLFSDPYSAGYKANFSNGVTFTVVDNNDTVHRVRVRITEKEPTVQEPELPDPPRPLSADTYFRAENAIVRDENGSGRYLNSYIMPYDADGYYYNGYQTVFVMDTDENGNEIPLAENTTIYPTFYTGYMVHMYAAHDATSGSLQTSGETSAEFSSGAITQYSAAAENGTHLKNYWVTYLTQQTEEDSPRLFINGMNDETRYITVDGEQVYQREVFLVEDFGNYHDIFFANLGTEALDGMYVRLENAENVALDEYWTITEGSSLQAFETTADNTDYGELQNVGKVRLRADLAEDGSEAYGAISGTLIIGYTGAGDAGEEYRIELTGIAANPQVTTSVMADAVKYVPYSQLIMTNNMYDNDKVRFDIVGGELPPGIELRPNGEIYGLPTEVGEYTFEAEITFTSAVYGVTITDVREYTINVLDNTDANVFWTNEPNNQGYEFTEDETEDGYVGTEVPDHEILRHVWVDEDSYVTVDFDDIIVDEYEWELFWSEGPHDEQFMYFFLDAQELVRDVDYTSEEGSTKINIQSQTFRDAGEGHHTIAAEFRTGKTDDGLMKRTSQNVYVHNIKSGPTGGDTGTAAPDSSYIDKILDDLKQYAQGQAADSKEKPIENESVVSGSQHSITFVQSEGGTIESSYIQAMEGTLVTVTVAPFEEFEVKTIEAVGDTAVSMTRVSDTEYTFTMPDSPVEIRVSFEYTGTVILTELPFGDVHKSSWFFDSIAYVYSKGQMNGIDAVSFAPNAPTSRGMIVTVLYRMAGEPAVADPGTFADVASGSYYEDAIAWAAENGIMEGYNASRFGADDSVTREQMATILYRYAEHTGRDTSAANMLINFEDADQISAYAVPAMEWANAEGLILGTTETRLNPTGDATRAQIAAILTRFQRGE